MIRRIGSLLVFGDQTEMEALAAQGAAALEGSEDSADQDPDPDPDPDEPPPAPAGAQARPAPAPAIQRPGKPSNTVTRATRPTEEQAAALAKLRAQATRRDQRGGRVVAKNRPAATVASGRARVVAKNRPKPAETGSVKAAVVAAGNELKSRAVAKGREKANRLIAKGAARLGGFLG